MVIGHKTNDGVFHPHTDHNSSGVSKQQFLPPNTSSRTALPKTQKQYMLHRLHLFGSSKITEEQQRIREAGKKAKEDEKIKNQKAIDAQKKRIENYREDLIRRVKESRDAIENEKEILKALEKGRISASELVAIEREIEQGMQKPTLPKEITDREKKAEAAKQKRIEESLNITPITPKGSQTPENYHEKYQKEQQEYQEKPEPEEVKEEKSDEEIKPNERESLFKIQATGEP